MIKILLLIFLWIANINSQDMKLNSDQARQTIKLIVISLLTPDNHAGNYAKEISDFIDNKTKIILEKSGVYSSFWSFNKIYNYNELYNSIISELIYFIEQKSLDYAQEDILNFYLPAQVNKKDLIRKVGNSIKSEVLKIIMQSSTLTEGALTHLIGALLRVKVHKVIINELKNYPNDKDQNLGSSQACPGCYGYFNAIAKNVVLDCGHNICADCLKNLYNQYDKNANCPICKNNILRIETIISDLKILRN